MRAARCSSVGGVVVSFYFSWRLALVCVAFLPALGFAGAWLKSRGDQHDALMMKAYAAAASVANEALAALKTVTAFGGQHREIARYAGNLRPAELEGRRKHFDAGLGMVSNIMWTACVHHGWGRLKTQAGLCVWPLPRLVPLVRFRSPPFLSCTGTVLLRGVLHVRSRPLVRQPLGQRVQRRQCGVHGGPDGFRVLLRRRRGHVLFRRAVGHGAGWFLPPPSSLPTPSFLFLPSYSFLPTPSWRPRLDAYPCAVQVGLIFPVWATITTAAVAASRLYEVIDEATAADATDQGARSSAPADDGGGIVLQPDSVRGDICFKNVTFAYPSRPNDVILRDFSLAITGGTSTALVGDSGSGKSTLLQLILRMYEPQAGEVTLDGVNVKDINLDSLRSVFGLVAQVCVRSKHTTVLRAARRSLGWSS